MKKITLITSCALLCFAYTAKSQIITTVAGSASQGYAGDGGQATLAELYGPSALAFDKSGNYYFADEENDVVRMVNISTGVITTVAGTGGVAGYTGDNGAATAATLFWPTGIAIDSIGNIYIGDYRNHVVRKVTKSTGLISTVAGTHVAGYNGDGILATAAQLDAPRDLAIDKSGNILIADAGNNRIRKIDILTGMISTVAGNGTGAFLGDGGLATAAELYYPYGVALDDSDNIYIADQSNNRIREVRAATNIITTIAGNGVASHMGDGGLATAAEINTPCTMCIAGNGDVFIAGTSEATVRKVTRATGIISTFVGDATQGYFGDGGLATSAEISNPSGVTLDNLGDLYVSDWGNARVRKVTLAESTAGIQNMNYGNSSISIYPNPANQQVFVAINGIEGQVSVAVYSMLGQQVLSETTSAGQTFALNTSSLTNGLYLVKIQTANGVNFVRKVEIEK